MLFHGPQKNEWRPRGQLRVDDSGVKEECFSD